MRGSLDIGILRFPASASDWAGRILATGCTALPADTLVYFDRALPGEQAPKSSFELVMPDRQQFASAISQTFKGYRNHHTANPLLSRDDALDGYLEWALSYLDDPGPNRIARTFSADGESTGFVTIELQDARAEVVLVGILPTFQGRGLYDQLLAQVEAMVHSLGAEAITISSQLANQASIRTWIRRGYTFETAFTTLHLLSEAAAAELTAG